jgi:hypothetical protein
MIRLAEYIEALDDEEIPDDEAAERIVLIAQEWSEEEEKIIHSYLDKYIHTLDKNTLYRRARRLKMVGKILLEKADDLERLFSAKTLAERMTKAKMRIVPTKEK